MAPQTPEHLSPEPDGRTAVPPPDSAGANDITLSEALLTLRKRKYVILAVALLGVAYGFYKGATQPRLFNAYGRIEIRSGASNEYRVSGGSYDPGTSVRMPTEVAILKSDTLLFTVAQDLDLANNPDFLGLKQKPPHVNTDDPAVRQNIVNQMQGAIDVTFLPKTDIIRIGCNTLNAKLSADIVNKLIDEYITRSVESRVKSQIRASAFLTGTLDDLKHRVEASQEQLIDLQKRLGLLAIDPTHNEISSSLQALTAAAGEAQINRILAESRYRVLSGMDPNAVDESIGKTAGGSNSQLSALRQELELYKGTYASQTATLGPNYPTVVAARSQIAELTKAIDQEQNALLLRAKETLVAAQANEDETHAALEAEKSEAYKLRDDFVEYTIRQREFDSNRSLYEGLLSRLQTAGVQAGLESTEIDIVDQAMPPPGPSLQSRNTIVLINTLVAAVLGIILAFILESLDTGLRSVAEIEAVSGLPSLALIPRSRRAGVDVSGLTIAQRNLATLSSPKSQFAEAFRALRTSLLLSTAGRPPNVILLTSATPSEGKTTISTNLACVLAQRDVRVLLIDADLRRPTVHHRLGLNGKVGLTSVLTGSCSVEDAVQQISEIPTLDILVSGPVPPFPTEMLGSETMESLLRHCRGIYSHIVIDSPPLLSVTDGVILARDADAVVLIVRHGKSGRQTVRRARDLLLRAGAPVTGITINAVDLNSPEYYGYYGYTGYSGYSGYSGYGSGGVDSTAWESQPGSDAAENGDKK